MNGTLPGLLDDPNITPTITTRNNVHIPPLRNPHPSRNAQAPLPLELIDTNYLDDQDRPHYLFTAGKDDPTKKPTPSAPAEAKKPHLAISELVDTPGDVENGQLQLPSFVSLSVVERSPTQKQSNITNNDDFPNKRPRLESEPDVSTHDRNRLLPMPVQKDGQQKRPLLPAMVTGLHEPPPSAALLPSMDPDSRPAIQRAPGSKMQVKDILLLETQRVNNSRPPEQMLNTPEVPAAELPRNVEIDTSTTDVDTPSTATSVSAPVQLPKKDPKVRRARRKWSEAETQDLLAGVRKHGFGKWKQILNDPTYTFADRTSIDLKDRYRVFAKDYQDEQPEGTPEDDIQIEPGEGHDAQMNRSLGSNAPTNKTRRRRHPWTSDEDTALLQGVTKYGFQWTSIHDDPDLGLSHRRATDLRDRIRNLYPDGYKHAEARPLRSEVKKAERAGKKETPAGVLYAPPNQMDSINFSSESRSTPSTGPSPRSVTRRQTTSGRVPSIASLTQNSELNDVSPSRPSAPRRSKTVAEHTTTTTTAEQNGITLPSLAFDSANDTDEWDNTLPPFINWDHENQEMCM